MGAKYKNSMSLIGSISFAIALVLFGLYMLVFNSQKQEINRHIDFVLIKYASLDQRIQLSQGQGFISSSELLEKQYLMDDFNRLVELQKPDEAWTIIQQYQQEVMQVIMSNIDTSIEIERNIFNELKSIDTADYQASDWSSVTLLIQQGDAMVTMPSSIERVETLRGVNQALMAAHEQARLHVEQERQEAIDREERQRLREYEMFMAEQRNKKVD